MRFGVNYTPASGWFHSWQHLREEDVRRDLGQIATLGVDHIRIFPLWPVVQPNRSLISQTALDDVMTVVDVAAEFGLDVNLDVLQGHLSSYDFLPAWITTWHRRNLFTDPDVVRAEADLAAEFARRLEGRPNIMGITLGNELNQFAPPIHPDAHPVTPEQASAWLGTLVAGARSHGDPFVTNAMYDASWYDDRQPFEPRHAVEFGDATVVHSWVFNGAAQTFGPLHDGSVRHAEYLLRLSAAWHQDATRPVWLQEVGAPTTVIPRESAPDFLEATIRHAATVPGLMGVTWWCSHDVSRALADFPEVEYDLGLFTHDGELKPTGERFAALVAEFRAAGAAAGSAGGSGGAGGAVAAVEPSGVALVLDDTAEGYRASCAPGGAFHGAWLDAAAVSGQGPQVLLASRGQDPAALAARGIITVLESDASAPGAITANR
ncbi:glycoside hydrolase 5 family protein [Arthrobacter woluwensis]|uniref:glycoside hydrolase 5 family protein n=1 Tax=Arthrobacter woluwensis TaxID=156980 RepID=UPI00119F2BA7|nr:glycosyl hydrolase [Arthrobacter woluwensis]